ncbi:MAG: msrB [Verrucomicrobia bacterium]|jgi:peptide-methionine (R)-S-oxide reductase|nr:msrB [Verrucomicrobiota bacterium]
MSVIKAAFYSLLLVGAFGLLANSQAEEKTKSPSTTTNAPKPAMKTDPKPAGTNATPAKVVKTEAEWRAQLTPEQYRVLREAGTERAFGAAYEEFKKQGGGTYHCAGCNAELFSSKEKFDSHCGWPSFYDPANAKNVKTKVDISFGSVRTEVLCAVCDGHLGHVFKGEGFKTPTDQRYCINGVSLKFVPFADGGTAPKK